MSWSQIKSTGWSTLEKANFDWPNGQLENKWNCKEKAAKISLVFTWKKNWTPFLVERRKDSTLQKKRASRKDYVKFRKFSSVSTPERNEL